MKRILITGITGYTGSNLARSLIGKYEVFGLVREPVNMEYIHDIAQNLTLLSYDGTYGSMDSAFKGSRPELIYHLAAYYTGAHGAEETPKLVDANITLGAYLLEAMSAQGCPLLVFASSVMAHYQGEVYRPLNLYAATKQAFSDLLAYYTNAGLLRAVTLILSDTYGPGDHRPKVLNLIRKAVQSGEPIELSDGGQDYDAVYIDDVTDAFKLAGEMLSSGSWKNERFQICAESPLTLREAVETFLEKNHLTLRAEWGRRPQAERGIRRAIRLYPTLPGWKARVSLADGLRRMNENTLYPINEHI